MGRRQYVDQHTYLPDQILALTDRMSMAVSLEVRVPFLDWRLVRGAARIRGADKHAGGDFKQALKRALGERVPEQILTRPKWGFASPVGRWLTTPELLPAVQALPRRLADVLDPRAVRRYVTDAHTVAAYADHVWALLALYVWRRVHTAPSAPDTPLLDLLHDA